jgi:hypothetical protein
MGRSTYGRSLRGNSPRENGGTSGLRLIGTSGLACSRALRLSIAARDDPPPQAGESGPWVSRGAPRGAIAAIVHIAEAS